MWQRWGAGLGGSAVLALDVARSLYSNPLTYCSIVAISAEWQKRSRRLDSPRRAVVAGLGVAGVAVARNLWAQHVA